jgi:hypothetical protein
MSTPIHRGVVHGNTVVLHDDATAIPEGTEVFVTPIEQPRRGSPQALLAALAKTRPLTDEEARQMLKDIEEAYD